MPHIPPEAWTALGAVASAALATIAYLQDRAARKRYERRKRILDRRAAHRRRARGRRGEDDHAD